MNGKCVRVEHVNERNRSTRHGTERVYNGKSLLSEIGMGEPEIVKLLHVDQ